MAESPVEATRRKIHDKESEKRTVEDKIRVLESQEGDKSSLQTYLEQLTAVQRQLAAQEEQLATLLAKEERLAREASVAPAPAEVSTRGGAVTAGHVPSTWEAWMALFYFMATLMSKVILAIGTVAVLAHYFKLESRSAIAGLGVLACWATVFLWVKDVQDGLKIFREMRKETLKDAPMILALVWASLLWFVSRLCMPLIWAYRGFWAMFGTDAGMSERLHEGPVSAHARRSGAGSGVGAAP